MSATAQEHPEFASEQDFLRHAAACLRAMRDGVARAGDAGGDPKASAALARHREKVLERLENPDTVVFGRIDFKDGGKYYVGPRRIETGEPLVINWAAPVARPFYEATPAEPAGLSLRRRMRTDRDRLLGIADEWFGSISVEPTIGDILLDELTRERTGEMLQVAATIQSDQYRIIERPFDVPTVVQGGPGTGKTIVGLHRAALLLYRHREQLMARRVLVVGPNEIFMRYIAYVLPSLGETAVDQVVVDNLGGLRATRTDDNLVARVKGDTRMAEVLRRAVVDRVRRRQQRIDFAPPGGPTFSVEPEVIEALTRDFDARSVSYVNARLQFRAAFERAVLAEYETVSRRRLPGLQPPHLSLSDMPEYDRVRDRIWPTITPQELVRQFLASEERIERACEGVLDEVERRLLYRKPVERLEQVEWSTSDIPLVDEVQQLIEPAARAYGHVIVDEAQDLTPMQLRMVGRRVSGGATTVLGDLAQATGLWSYATWDEVMGHLGFADRVEPEELTYAYRVPREIMERALPVLALTAPSITPPVPFRDGGHSPIFVETDRQRRAIEVVNSARAAHESGGTAAIIAPPSFVDALRSELHATGTEFGDADEGEWVTSIELLDPRASKGLEFDHVVIAEPAAMIREAEGLGQRDLYVALTRATRTLTCVHAEPLPWPLGEQPVAPPVLPTEAAPVPVAERPEPAGASLSVGEALVLARMRGLSMSEALARALLVDARGGSEADVIRAILDPSTVDEAVVASVIAAARE
jgi:DNA helicase IV